MDMDEMIRCRLKPLDAPGVSGWCTLTRRDTQLRTEAELSGVKGVVEIYLFPGGGDPLCAEAFSAFGGVWKADRGVAWFSGMPIGIVVTRDGEPILWTTLPGSGLTKEGMVSALRAGRAEEPAAVTVQAVRQPEIQPAQNTAIQPVGFGETQGRTVLPAGGVTVAGAMISIQAQASTATLPEGDSTQAPGDAAATTTALPQDMETQSEGYGATAPEEAFPPRDPFLPSALEEPLPWALDARGVRAALTRGEEASPFPGLLPGAKFARLRLPKSFLPVDHYIVGVIPVGEDRSYLLAAVPGPPGGLPEGIPVGFSHYLPAREGAGYWVRYFLEE